MELYEDGTFNMDIDVATPENKIDIPHKTLPSDLPQLVHTQIRNKSISFYDKDMKLVQTTTIDLPDMHETIAGIKKLGDEYSQDEINQTIATMQGHPYLHKLDEFIAQAPTKEGITVLEQGETYATIRVDMMAMDNKSTYDVVYLMDRIRNKIAGQRIYDKDDKITQTSYYGYNNGKQQYLNAIKTEQNYELPTGNQIKMVSNSYIDNYQININL